MFGQIIWIRRVIKLRSTKVKTTERLQFWDNSWVVFPLSPIPGQLICGSKVNITRCMTTTSDMIFFPVVVQFSTRQKHHFISHFDVRLIKLLLRVVLSGTFWSWPKKLSNVLGSNQTKYWWNKSDNLDFVIWIW